MKLLDIQVKGQVIQRSNFKKSELFSTQATLTHSLDTLAQAPVSGGRHICQLFIRHTTFNLHVSLKYHN